MLNFIIRLFCKHNFILVGEIKTDSEYLCRELKVDRSKNRACLSIFYCDNCAKIKLMLEVLKNAEQN